MIRYFVIFPAFMSIVGCSDIECANESIAEVVSPDGTKKIVLFSRNCGATTGFNTQGSVLNRRVDLPNESGSAFIIDNGTAKVFWADNSKLIVIFESSARVLKRESSDCGITIDYQFR